MMPHLDIQRLAESGAMIFGFSDNSILPTAVAAHTGLVTFHGLCDVAFGFGEFALGRYSASQDSFREALQGRFDLGGSHTWTTVQPGDVEGTCLGGNLHALVGLIGTPWWPNWREKILFVESADPLRVVFQDFTHLNNAGVFDKIAGLVIGATRTWDEDFYDPETMIGVDDFLLDVIDLRGKFPIVKNADIGHNVDNIVVPVGALTRLTAQEVRCEWNVPQLP